MGWSNPDVPWSELEAALSGRAGQGDETGASLPNGPHSSVPRSRPPGMSLSGGPEADGGDSPAWSRKREPYRAAGPPAPTSGPRVPYAELHCHSNFSFLDGASHPEELVEQAARLGLDALALTDHDGMYGVVRFAEAAAELGVRTVFGAELSLGLTAPQNGVADPEGSHLLLLARDPDGYRGLCRTISTAQLAGKEKGRPVYDLEEVVADTAGHVLVLTGCRKGAVRQALGRGGRAAAAVALRGLAERFGPENVAVELSYAALPTDVEVNDALAGLAADTGLPTVATTAAHYATSERFPLATALAAVRARRSLDEADGWLPPAGTAHLRPGAEMAARFDARHPGAVARAARLGAECAFTIDLVAPDLPPFETPPGHHGGEVAARAHPPRSPAALRQLRRVPRSGRHRGAGAGGHRGQEVPRLLPDRARHRGLLPRVGDPVPGPRVGGELRGLLRAGDHERGRGVARPAVRAVPVPGPRRLPRHRPRHRVGPPGGGHPVRLQPLRARSGGSGGERDQLPAPLGRARRRAGAGVLAGSAGRVEQADRAVAPGLCPTAEATGSLRTAEVGPGMPEQVGELANELLGFPRHLGIHSGGMVICDRPVAEVVPVEWARMDGRTVVQWDKDDCAAAGLVKFDLLGLGMLTALHLMIDLVAEHHGRRVALHELQPVDPEVYAMLARGDSVGVFQVESRAQIATLPRLRPRKFYDLVVEVALIRPGPIQGGSVHPYIRRRNKQEEWEHDHPLLENALEKTLGVPLFQEQLMQVAVDVAGFSPAEADELRRAMGAKRSTERMERLRGRFYEGMAVNGIEGALADKIFDRMLAFANFGFPESHSISFASLVYYSAWFKLYHPSAFCAALLNAQPMGFYSPQSLVADARRHGVRVRGPDVNLGGSRAVLQPDAHSAGGQAVRLGMAGIRTIGEKLGEQIEVERTRDGPYRDLADLARRVRLTVPQAEALATAGALGSFGVDRRAALWAAGVVAAVRPEQLPGTAVGLDAPALPGMTAAELTVADVWASGVSPDSHPIEHLRERLDRFGALAIDRLDAVGRAAGPDAPPRVLVGGLVTHRQRPATAGGVTFLNLEDETGMLNVTCSEGLWHRYRTVALGSAALLVRGRLERSEEGVLNLVADRLARLVLAVPVKSRDFR